MVYLSKLSDENLGKMGIGLTKAMLYQHVVEMKRLEFLDIRCIIMSSASTAGARKRFERHGRDAYERTSDLDVCYACGLLLNKKTHVYNHADRHIGMA